MWNETYPANHYNSYTIAYLLDQHFYKLVILGLHNNQFTPNLVH